MSGLRQVLGRVLLPLGMLLVCAAAFFLQTVSPLPFPQTVQLGAPLLIGGAVLIGAGMWRLRTLRIFAWEWATDASRWTPLRWRWMLAGIVLLTALTVVNVIPNTGVSLHVQMALWIGGMILCILGGSERGERKKGKEKSSPNPPLTEKLKLTRLIFLQGRCMHRPYIRRLLFPLFMTINKLIAQTGRRLRVHALLIAIFMIALGLRLWQLETQIHYLVDELNFIEGVVTLRDQPDVRLLTPFGVVTTFTWAYPYVQAQTTALIGSSFTALRLISAVFGALGIPALYLLGATVFNRRIGLIAALLLATHPVHLHFSRLGLNNIADPLFGTLGLALAARGLKHGTMRDFAAAGACLGLTAYFYEGGRLLFTPLAALLLPCLWFYGLWIDVGLPDRAALRRHMLRLRGLALLAFVLLWVTLPVYLTLLAGGYPLASRLGSQAIGSTFWRTDLGYSPLLEYGGRALNAALSFSYHPDSYWFYMGNTALVLPPLVPLLLLGACFAAWRAFQPGMLILLAWLLATILGNAFMATISHTARYVVALPAIALVLALGLDRTLALILRQNAVAPVQWLKPFFMGALFYITVALSFMQVGYYFGLHVPWFNTHFLNITLREDGLGFDLIDATLRVEALPPGTPVIMAGDFFILPNNVLLVQRYWGTTDRPVELFGALRPLSAAVLAALPEGVRYGFFLEPHDWQTRALVERYFRLEGPYLSPHTAIPQVRQMLLFQAQKIDDER